MSEQLVLTETPAMQRGSATMHWCNYCGAVLYVTSHGDGSRREWDAACPVCSRKDWTRIKRGQGPFVWEDR